MAMTANIAATHFTARDERYREGPGLDALLDILQPDCALAVAQRSLPEAVSQAAMRVCRQSDPVRIQLVADSSDTEFKQRLYDALVELTGNPSDAENLWHDACALVVNAEQVQHRLSQLVPEDRQMRVRLERINDDGCRLFHVDHIPFRLICTWHGAGTQWLPEHSVDRSRLGTGSNQHVLDWQAVEQIPSGAVAAMKGNTWPDEHGRGLVHRSPPACTDQPRLIIAVDLV